MPASNVHSRIKTLFILPTLGSGGAERVLITMMNHIDQSRFDVQFLALDENGPAKDWINKDIPFHSFGGKSIKRSILPLISFIKQHKPDVIFTTMVHTNSLAVIMKILFPHIRVIIRESSLPVTLINEYGWKGRLCKYIYKHLYPRADLVLSPSRVVTEEFTNDLDIDTSNHALLLNPVDTDKLYAGLPKSFAADKNRPETVRFGCLGRLSFEKGLDRLIDTLAAHKAKMPHSWHLDILGEGDEFDNLTAQIKVQGLAKNITLHGYNANPWAFLAQIDCLLLPSRWEGMPNVALESLACGIPVIAHKESGGITEIAAYANAEDVQVKSTMDEFIEAMKAVAPDPKTKPAPSRLPKEFSLADIIKTLEDYLAAKTS